MKIATTTLRQYIALVQEGRALRDLLDDVGLEVKRQDGDRITLELLANRGDHHCYLGIARELSGRTGAKLCGPIHADLVAGECPVALRLESALCPIYTATLLERSGEAQGFPAGTLAVLAAAEIHSVSPPVDATNVANLELGQPTHAFDADTISGGVVVRESTKDERAWPLFAEGPVTLPTGTLVIADSEKVLAIAGVIGCEESKTTEATTRVLLESAHFDPVAVRKASRALNIHTDSSARFERGSDPSLPLIGAGRVVHLLEAHAGWKRVGQTGVVGDWTDPARTIEIDVVAAGAFLAHPLSTAEISERLLRYGFGVTGEGPTLQVRVPPHRLWDVEYPADLYEELAKSIGYNQLPEGLPPVEMGAVPSCTEVVKAKVEEVLLGAGFYEVFTNGFHATNLRDRMGFEPNHPLWAHVETTNALDRGYGLVKNNALAQAVEAVSANRRVGVDPIRMYEWTRTFHPDAHAENKVCTERHLLWAIATGSDKDWSGTTRSADPWRMKGIVAEIATTLGLSLTVGPAVQTAPLSSVLHPGRQASIHSGGAIVGILGEVHPAVCAAFKLKRCRPIYMEIDRTALDTTCGQQRYHERPIHQPIVRSLAFTLPPGVRAHDVTERMRLAGPDWLDSVDIMDLFRHPEAGVDVRTLTFALRFTNDTGTRSADEVNTCCETIIAEVESSLGERGVKLRR